MAESWYNNDLTIDDITIGWEALLIEANEHLGRPDIFLPLRVVFAVSSVREALASIVYGLSHNLDFGVIQTDRLSEAATARFCQVGVTLHDYHKNTPLGCAVEIESEQVLPGRVTVLTSGTTGLLKLIPHDWKTLNTFDRVNKELAGNTWFLPYQIGSYAWYQLVSLSLFIPGQNLVCSDITDIIGSFEAALRQGSVTAISSTPTFWRQALMTIDAELLSKAPIRSISLGGEIVDQAILDRLKALYPAAALRHIYASSEAGAAIVVADGKAGFDADLAEKADRAIRIKVENGRLYINSSYNNKAGTDGWVDTQDIVERRGDRYYFCGRIGNTMINVGGQKAFPSDIESRLMSHPNVIWAQVSARQAPFVGYLPVAKVVLSGDIDPASAEQKLYEYCNGELAEYAVPRIWEFLDVVPMRASLKS